MADSVSGPTGFTKSTNAKDKKSVEAMLREGKDLVRTKNLQGKTLLAGEQILSRLLTVKTEDKQKDKKTMMMTLTGREHSKKPTTHLVALNAAVHSAVETHLHDSPSELVVREGAVEVMGKKNVLRKRWLVLTETHLEFRESQDKKVPLKRITVISSACERLPAQSLELVTMKKEYQLVFGSADETDMWLLEFARTRLRCASLCLDLVPMFRNLVLAKTTNSIEAVAGSSHERTPSSASTVRGNKLFATDMRFAHLAFEKVNVSYQIALQLHDTYVTDVERRLERLDALAADRMACRQRIAELEGEMGAEERLSQKAGRDLSDTFGLVLGSVGVLHNALSETHKDLVLISASSLTEDQAQNVELFREALDILDLGLMMDKPLKQQIHELELREAEAAGEVTQLSDKERDLEVALQKLRRKRAVLESVTSVSGKLCSAVEQASRTVLAQNQKDLDLSRIVSFAPLVREAAEQLPGLKAEAPKGEEERHEVAEVLGGVGLATAATVTEDSASTEEEKDLSPNSILQRLFKTPNAEAEGAVLRCFEYFIKPLLLMEHVTLSYCEGPKVVHSDQEVQIIEKRMASVRLRVLNFLRKWVKTHPYHFADAQMKQLLKTFLKCARLTGHEKLSALIETDIESATGESMRAIFDAAPNVVGISLSDVDNSPKRLSDVNALELARQLTLVDHELYRRIEHRELVKNNFMKKRSPHVAEFSAQFNHIAGVVAANILTAPSEHAAVIGFWIYVMQHLRSLRNYQGFFAVFGGLSNSSVTRLKKVWADVDKASYFEQCKALMDKNFSELRKELEAAARPVIPYLGFYQRDLVYLEEAPTFKGTNVNMGKLVSIATVIGNCLQYQSSFYSWFMPNEDVSNLFVNHKLLDEKEAHELSLKIEPRVVANTLLELEDGKGSVGSKTITRRAKSSKMGTSSDGGDLTAAVGGAKSSRVSKAASLRPRTGSSTVEVVTPPALTTSFDQSPSASPREAMSQKAQKLLGAEISNSSSSSVATTAAAAAAIASTTSPREPSPKAQKLLGTKPLPTMPPSPGRRSRELSPLGGRKSEHLSLSPRNVRKSQADTPEEGAM